MARSALVVIGNEILSGKIVDTNTPFLIAELRSLGVELAEIAVVPDEVARIAEAVARVASRSEHVFTSGGVGPTHDDVTMEGVAAAFAVPVIRHPRLEALLRGYYDAQKLPLEEANLRMADVPEGATLLEGPDLRWPVVAMRNVYVLPGIQRSFGASFWPSASAFGTLLLCFAASTFAVRKVRLPRICRWSRRAFRRSRLAPIHGCSQMKMATVCC